MPAGIMRVGLFAPGLYDEEEVQKTTVDVDMTANWVEDVTTAAITAVRYYGSSITAKEPDGRRIVTVSIEYHDE
jgi:hypothetical protein